MGRDKPLTTEERKAREREQRVAAREAMRARHQAEREAMKRKHDQEWAALDRAYPPRQAGW